MLAKVGTAIAFGQFTDEGKLRMAHDPTRRSLRMLAVIGALAALPLLAACNDSEEDDDDGDDDDSMRARPAVVVVVPN
jgi:hypothetical protein